MSPSVLIALIAGFGLGLLFGAVVAALLLSRRAALRDSEVAALTARLEEQGREKLALLQKAEHDLSDAFEALSVKALRMSNESFLELAGTHFEKHRQSAREELERRQRAIDELVKPVGDALTKMDRKIDEVEKSRLEAYGGLNQHLSGLAVAQKELRCADVGARSSSVGWWRSRGWWNIATSSSSSPSPRMTGGNGQI
jgi:hypothetical protein